jgi:hypothetical protein
MVSRCDTCGQSEAIFRPYLLFTTSNPEDFVPGDTTSGFLVPIYGPICKTCFEEHVRLLQEILQPTPGHPYWGGRF